MKKRIEESTLALFHMDLEKEEDNNEEEYRREYTHINPRGP